MFRLCLSNRKKRAMNKGEPRDLTVNLRARYPKGRLRTQETGAIKDWRDQRLETGNMRHKAIYQAQKEATMGFEPMVRVLQTLALPLGHVALIKN